MVLRGCRPRTCVLGLWFFSTPAWLASPFVLPAVSLGHQVRKKDHLCLMDSYYMLAGHWLPLSLKELPAWQN